MFAARLPRCCSKNFKVKTGSGAEKDPNADPPIEDEAPEPANEAEWAVILGLSMPDAELAEPAPPKAKPAEAVTAKPAPELAEAPTLRSDAGPLARSAASIDIQNPEFELISMKIPCA
jgi:hypothetical protein